MEGEEDRAGERHLPEVALAQLFVEDVAEAVILVCGQQVILLHVGEGVVQAEIAREADLDDEVVRSGLLPDRHADADPYPVIVAAGGRFRQRQPVRGQHRVVGQVRPRPPQVTSVHQAGTRGDEQTGSYLRVEPAVSTAGIYRDRQAEVEATLRHGEADVGDCRLGVADEVGRVERQGGLPDGVHGVEAQ